MNGKPASDEFLLEGGGRKMILLARDVKYVGLSDDPFDLLKIVRVISGNVKYTPGTESAMNREEKYMGESASAMMSPLWPWIGK